MVNFLNFNCKKTPKSMKTSTSIYIKLFLALYAGFITFIGTLSLSVMIFFDGVFWIISVTSSVCYIIYLKTRSVIELTILDRNV